MGNVYLEELVMIEVDVTTFSRRGRWGASAWPREGPVGQVKDLRECCGWDGLGEWESSFSMALCPGCAEFHWSLSELSTHLRLRAMQNELAH